MEEWVDIKEYEGLYQVSNKGRVRSVDRIIIGKDNKKYHKKGKILKQTAGAQVYYTVGLSKNGSMVRKLVHRLIAEAFIPNPENLPMINHKNEKRQDNKIENLEWCTNAYNLNYGTARKRAAKTKGKKIYQYTLDKVLIAEYDSVKIAAEKNGYNRGCISECALGKNYRKQHMGYIWSYNQL